MTATTTDRADAAAPFGLGRVTQISFVVEDLDRDLPTYEALFGPFRTWRAEVDGSSLAYRGEPAASTLWIGLGRSGDVDVELIAVEAGDHPAGEHLRTHGAGIQHVAFEVEDLDVKRTALVEAGFEVVVEGRTSTDIRFCHLQAPETLGYTVFELMQMPTPADTGSVA